MNDLTFSLTAAAARRILALVTEDGGALGLRISVSGGGCSGFQYGMELTKTQADDDVRFQHEGALVLIDSVSLPLVAGGILDFIEDISGSYFQISNPNATASCGCGNSFSA